MPARGFAAPGGRMGHREIVRINPRFVPRWWTRTAFAKYHSGLMTITNRFLATALAGFTVIATHVAAQGTPQAPPAQTPPAQPPAGAPQEPGPAGRGGRGQGG